MANIQDFKSISGENECYFSQEELQEMKALLTKKDMTQDDIDKLKSFFILDKENNCSEIDKMVNVIKDKSVMLAYLLSTE